MCSCSSQTSAELAHLGMTGMEKVTIDSLSVDKLVLSGGDTWKFDKTEYMALFREDIVLLVFQDKDSPDRDLANP